MKHIFTLLFFCLTFLAQAQLIGKAEYGTFALENATIITVTNGIKFGTVLISEGEITGIGDVKIPENAKRIDCKGKFIYPGFIDSGTKLGLNEIGAVSLSKDAHEVGNFTPHMKALTAINPSSVLIPVTRVSGVTTVLSVPQYSLFPGTAALINLWGYTPKQMYAGFEGIVINFPSTGRRGRWDKRSEEDVKKDAKKSLEKLDDYWKKAFSYTEMHSKSNGDVDYNPELESLRSSVKGTAKVLINCNSKNDILAAIKWSKKNKLQAVLTGVSEGYQVADSIAASGFPVITGPILKVPGSADAYDSAYKNAGIMQKAGVKVAIRTNDNENTRNLLYNAGFAATYGLGKEEALKSITIIPAEIFGISAEYGSLEKGKKANLFICDGDPFETQTTIEQVFINGWKIPMESRHSLLYDEFLKRSPGIE